MNRVLALSGAGRTIALAGVIAVGLLAVAGVAVAASGVSIVASGGQYHFQPGDINVNAGATVTWTDNSATSHTISSDDPSGPLNGAVNPTSTYQATFDTAGDFAYHCNIHTYMHGTVHVAALPPTDAVGVQGNTGLLVSLAALGSLAAVTGLGLRLRRREERAEG